MTFHVVQAEEEVYFVVLHHCEAGGEETTANLDLSSMDLAQDAALTAHSVGDATESLVDESHDAAFLCHPAAHDGALSACVH